MPAALRALQVLHKHPLTPHMIRIVLGGEELAGFPAGQESAYIKLLLPKHALAADNKGKWQQAMEARQAAKETVFRSYTIRAHDEEKGELTLDFVNHGEGGPASAWAINAVVGDWVMVRDPGPVKLLNPDADWFLLAGDMTALPAISVNLEKLPADAQGYAVIEVMDEADFQDLVKPEGVELHWLVNPHPDQANSLLADKVRALPWHEGTASVWLASEFDTMRQLRPYLKKERGVTKDNLYISSYWKMGVSDEGHKAAKKADVEED